MVDVLPASEVHEFDHLEALHNPGFVVDVTGKVLFANEASRRVVDASGDHSVFLTELVPAEERPGFREVLDETRRGHSWRGRVQLTWRDQRTRACDVSCSPIAGTSDGQHRVLVVIADAGDDAQHTREGQIALDRLTRLGRVAADLAACEDMEAVRDVVVIEAADALGATVGSMSLLVDPRTLVLVGLRGGTEGAAERWSIFPVDENSPAGQVVLTESMVLLVGREEIDARFPHLERAAEGERSMVALPLVVTGHVIGVITWSFPGRRTFEAPELEFLNIVADSCAQTIERIHAREHAAEQAARVRFMADVTGALATSLDYASTLTNVARMAVPRFADWCAIDLLEDGRLHRLAVEHVDANKVQLAMELQNRYPADESSGAWQVIRTAETMYVPEVTDAMITEGVEDPEQAEAIRQLHLRSVILVPLVARGRVLGVMTWVMAESERRYDATDVPFAEDMAQRAAVAIDNAQLYSQTHEAAVRLQRAVLPELGGTIGGWEVAAHYTPAGRTEVGGDFYDVIELPDGDVAMFLGDVMGRGVGAAAAMAQMRAALRAYIAIDPWPRAVVDTLDRLFTTYQFSQLVTLVYAVFSRKGSHVTMVNAGHPSPLVAHRDGTVSQLGDATGPPLGTGIGGYDVVQAELSRGDVILAFSDGLIERRDEDIDEGMARAAAVAARLAEADLADALDGVVDEVRDHSRDDDVAALALRLRTD